MSRKQFFDLSAIALSAVLLAFASRTSTACSAPGMNTLHSVVRVSSSHGVVASGVVIGPGWVLTAAHILKRDAALQISAAAGEQREAFLRTINSQLDLALLAADTSGMTPVAIGAGDLQSGEPVWAAGYPRDGELTMSNGHYQTDRNGRLQTDAYIDSGQSGGALFNCRNGAHELAGIVHGFLALTNGKKSTNTGESLAVTAVSVRRFLEFSGHHVMAVSN